MKSDLELVRKCAERMGYTFNTHHQTSSGIPIWLDRETRNSSGILSGDYNPLVDDAQAMAMVKKFRLDILDQDDEWLVGFHSPCVVSAKNKDLNRAICECVANLPE